MGRRPPRRRCSPGSPGGWGSAAGLSRHAPKYPRATPPPRGCRRLAHGRCPVRPPFGPPGSPGGRTPPPRPPAGLPLPGGRGHKSDSWQAQPRPWRSGAAPCVLRPLGPLSFPPNPKGGFSAGPSCTHLPACLLEPRHRPLTLTIHCHVFRPSRRGAGDVGRRHGGACGSVLRRRILCNRPFPPPKGLHPRTGVLLAGAQGT